MLKNVKTKARRKPRAVGWRNRACHKSFSGWRSIAYAYFCEFRRRTPAPYKGTFELADISFAGYETGPKERVSRVWSQSPLTAHVKKGRKKRQLLLQIQKKRAKIPRLAVRLGPTKHWALLFTFRCLGTQGPRRTEQAATHQRAQGPGPRPWDRQIVLAVTHL